MTAPLSMILDYRLTFFATLSLFQGRRAPPPFSLPPSVQEMTPFSCHRSDRGFRAPPLLYSASRTHIHTLGVFFFFWRKSPSFIDDLPFKLAFLGQGTFPRRPFPPFRSSKEDIKSFLTFA